MSEIPLHAFGRSRKARAGYTPLQSGEPGDEDGDVHDSGERPDMRTAVRVAASSSSINRKGKRRERYADNPEEEETLLGGAVHGDADFPEDEAGEAPSTREPSSQVRRASMLHCTSGFTLEAEVRLVAQGPLSG